MNDDMMKMLMAAKGKGDKMSPEEQQAKMDVLKELLDLAHGEMGNRVKHGMDEMQKVSVMAPDKSKLLEGLDKAKDLMGADSDDDSSEDALEDAATKADDMPSEEAAGSADDDSVGLEKPMAKEDLLAATDKMKPKKKLFSMLDDEDEE